MRAVAGARSSVGVRGVSTEARITELGLTLPEPSAPKGTYIPVTRTGNLLLTAGHLPQDASGELRFGKVGEDVTVEEGYDAA